MLPVPKGPVYFMFLFIIISYSDILRRLSQDYYVMTTGFLFHNFFKFFVEQLHCLVVVVACRGIDLYSL